VLTAANSVTATSAAMHTCYFQNSDNPDLRDRGFVYWRLLATNPEAAKAVVLSEKPTIGMCSDVVQHSLSSHYCYVVSCTLLYRTVVLGVSVQVRSAYTVHTLVV
jgi:vesicle coat complex subunit